MSLVDFAQQKNAVDFKKALEEKIQEKVAESLQESKVEVAGSLLGESKKKLTESVDLSEESVNLSEGKLKRFTKSDWMGYNGAKHLPDGSDPYVHHGKHHSIFVDGHENGKHYNVGIERHSSEGLDGAVANVKHLTKLSALHHAEFLAKNPAEAERHLGNNHWNDKNE